MLTLDRNLPYQTLAMASPADSGLYAAGTPATILGWGDTTEGGSASPVLLGATVPVVSDATCKAAYKKYDVTAMVCARRAAWTPAGATPAGRWPPAPG